MFTIENSLVRSTPGIPDAFVWRFLLTGNVDISELGHLENKICQYLIIKDQFYFLSIYWSKNTRFRINPIDLRLSILDVT